MGAGFPGGDLLTVTHEGSAVFKLGVETPRSTFPDVVPGTASNRLAHIERFGTDGVLHIAPGFPDSRSVPHVGSSEPVGFRTSDGGRPAANAHP